MASSDLCELTVDPHRSFLDEMSLSSNVGSTPWFSNNPVTRLRIMKARGTPFFVLIRKRAAIADITLPKLRVPIDLLSPSARKPREPSPSEAEYLLINLFSGRPVHRRSPVKERRIVKHYGSRNRRSKSSGRHFTIFDR